MGLREWWRWFVLVGAVVVTKIGNWRSYGEASSSLVLGLVLECD